MGAVLLKDIVTVTDNHNQHHEPYLLWIFTTGERSFEASGQHGRRGIRTHGTLEGQGLFEEDTFLYVRNDDTGSRIHCGGVVVPGYDV